MFASVKKLFRRGIRRTENNVPHINPFPRIDPSFPRIDPSFPRINPTTPAPQIIAEVPLPMLSDDTANTANTNSEIRVNFPTTFEPPVNVGWSPTGQYATQFLPLRLVDVTGRYPGEILSKPSSEHSIVSSSGNSSRSSSSSGSQSYGYHLPTPLPGRSVDQAAIDFILKVIRKSEAPDVKDFLRPFLISTNPVRHKLAEFLEMPNMTEELISVIGSLPPLGLSQIPWLIAAEHMAINYSELSSTSAMRWDPLLRYYRDHGFAHGTHPGLIAFLETQTEYKFGINPEPESIPLEETKSIQLNPAPLGKDVYYPIISSSGDMMDLMEEQDFMFKEYKEANREVILWVFRNNDSIRRELESGGESFQALFRILREHVGSFL